MMKNKQNYAQLECLECLKLTNKMLEDEMKAVIAYCSRFKKQFLDPKRKIIDLSYDQACEMVRLDPRCFMHGTNDQKFTPVVKGQQIAKYTPELFRIVIEPPPAEEQSPGLVRETAVKQPTLKKKKVVHEEPHWHSNQFDGMTKNNLKEYGPCKLAAHKLEPYKHLQKHQVNTTIQKVNQVVMTLFKQKVKADDQTIVALLKYFNVPVPRGNGAVLDYAELKKPDFLFTVNIRLMQKLNKVLNQENNNAKPETSTQ